MFNVGDRVEIVNPIIDDFKGERGTIIYDRLTHMYDGYQVFDIRLDREVELGDSKRFVRHYPAKADELIKIDVPSPTKPPKKRKWYQWGTK